MKRCPFIFLLLLYFTPALHAQDKKPDSLIRKLFASLQAKDEKAFLALCPDSAQLVRIMKRIEWNLITMIEAERTVWRERSKKYVRRGGPITSTTPASKAE